MLRWSAVLGVLVAALGFAASAGAATSSSGSAARDAASTRAFINGEVAIDRATLAHGPAELAAGTAYAAAVMKECGDVRLHIPKPIGAKRFLVFFEFVGEIAVGFSDVSLASVRPTVGRVARIDEGLQFSDPALAWQVHGSTAAYASLLALRPPDVCADARRLEASKFRSMTPAGRQFSRDAFTLIGGMSSSGALAHKMRTYAPGAVARGLQRLHRLDQRASKLPVARIELRLFKHFLGPVGGKTGSSTPVRSALGAVGHAQL